jgi:hypothetical protein
MGAFSCGGAAPSEANMRDMAIIDRLLAPGSGFQKNFFFLAKRFVAGETIESAIAAVADLNAAGMTATLDYLGEDVLEREAAVATREAYIAVLERVHQSGVESNVSVKMTAMGLLIDQDFALANLTGIVDFAQRNRDPFVRIDMEGSAVTDATCASSNERMLARRPWDRCSRRTSSARPPTSSERSSWALACGSARALTTNPPEIAIQGHADDSARLHCAPPKRCSNAARIPPSPPTICA